MNIDIDWQVLLILLPFVFFANIIDSIAGGGGVITWIGFLVSGIPMQIAYSTNAIQATSGTAVSSINYILKGHTDKRYLLFGTIGAIIGSMAGTYVVTLASDGLLRILMLCALPLVAIFIACHDKLNNVVNRELSLKEIYLISFFGCLILGFYCGFIGPGTGTMLMVGFTMVGLKLIDASGNARIIDFVMCLVSMIVFLMNGIVSWQIAIPCVIFSILGSQIGSRMAINGGDKVIKPAMIFVAFLLLIKLGYDVFL